MTDGHGKGVVLVALAANFCIAVAKFVAAFFTHSSALLAEACHSVADTVNQGLLLLGMRLSKRPADRQHPFGYAMDRYFWAFIVAVTIFTVGSLFSIYEGVHKIASAGDAGVELKHPLWGVGVLSLGILLEGGSLLIALRAFNKQRGGRPVGEALDNMRDPVLLTVLFEDSAAMAGLIIALIGLLLAWLTGNVIFDGIASVMVGIVLAVVAWFLAKETRDLLLGESVSPEKSATIRRLVLARPMVDRLLIQRTMHLGPEEVLLALRVEFNDGLTTDELETEIVSLEAELSEALPELKRIWTEPGRSDVG